MGTAPATGSNPAMPDPDRLVRRSIAMLEKIGYSEDTAARIVLACTYTLADDYPPAGQWAYEWVVQIRLAAAKRVKFLRPSTNDAEVNENADGRSSRTGGHESTA